MDSSAQRVAHRFARKLNEKYRAGEGKYWGKGYLTNLGVHDDAAFLPHNAWGYLIWLAKDSRINANWATAEEDNELRKRTNDPEEDEVVIDRSWSTAINEFKSRLTRVDAQKMMKAMKGGGQRHIDPLVLEQLPQITKSLPTLKRIIDGVGTAVELAAKISALAA